MSKHTPADVARMAGGKAGKTESTLVVAGLRTPKGAQASVTLDTGFGKQGALWLRVTPTHVDAMRKLVDAQLHPSTGNPLWRWNDRRCGWYAYVSATTLAWLASLGLDTGMSADTPAPKAATPKGKATPAKGKAATRKPAQASTPTPKTTTPDGALSGLTTQELVTRIDRRMAEIGLLVNELKSRTSK